MLIFCIKTYLFVVVRNTIGDQLESTFEQVTCEAVLDSANYIIAKKLDFLTNLTFEHGPLKLNYHLNKTVTVDQDAIRVHLNGRFDGDSGDLKVCLKFIWFQDNYLIYILHNYRYISKYIQFGVQVGRLGCVPSCVIATVVMCRVRNPACTARKRPRVGAI